MPAAPSVAASFVSWTECAVSFVPVPATTGIVTASATAAKRESRSSSVEHGRFAGGAGHHEAVVAVVLQLAGQRPGHVEVEPALLVERGDHRH